MKMKWFTMLALVLPLSIALDVQAGDPIVPGTGVKVDAVGDDFEDESWSYSFNGYKSSEEMDKNRRLPAGRSANGRWYEGIKRGHPDVIKRVLTPEGGLPGSQGALLLQSIHTGIPNRPTYRQQQDDFIANVNNLVGGNVPVWRAPNVVTRVYFPPVDEWENRSGCHFAFRVALTTTVRKSNGIFGSKSESETYWPGMFVDFRSQGKGQEHDYAFIRVRANSRGGEYKGKQIEVTGWWTMGISVSPDGQVHYYAKPGLEDLGPEDRIASEFPYGFRAERFKTFFFNVCSGDDGRTPSTAFIVDDPTVYFVDRQANAGRRIR